MNAPLVMRFLPAAGATAVVALVCATRPLPAVPRGIAIACVVGAWASAALFRRKDLRAHATVVASIAAVTAAGQIDAGLPYALGCLLVLFGCLVSMRGGRTPSLETRRPGRPKKRVVLVLAIGATAITTGLLLGLPRLAEHVERRLNAMFEGDGDQATAFSTTMTLGSTRGILQSDAIVLRIDGERPAYLRGAVYDRYDPPFWVTSGRGRTRTTIPAAAFAGTARITLVRGTPNGEDMRWFLPPRACDLVVASGSIEIDAFGVARRPRAEDPPVLAYRTATCTRPPIVPLPPDSNDLDVPRDVRHSLAPIVAGWTASAKTPREKLDALQHELGRFEYSLAVPLDTRSDPVVDFVTVQRAGHCELFASAMVLMARAEGIPARVVGGYRVNEVNRWTGRAVVRDRNAHAWVEAWVEGAWREWDPTPMGESFRRGPGTIENAGDVLSDALDVVVAVLTKLGTIGIAAILGVILVLLLLVRWLEGHFRTRRGRQRRAAESSLPLPCFDALTDELNRAGHPRDESEPLEAFARRLAALPAPWARDVSVALLEYASYRYGGIGEEAEVVGLLERARHQLVRRSKAAIFA